VANAEFFADIFPADFWDRIDRTKLIEDRHSFFGDAEVFEWLIRTTRPEVIVELGSWKGHSANYMADVCRQQGLNTKIICVDTFNGSAEHWHDPGMRAEMHLTNGRPTILERFMGNTVARGNTDHVFPLPLDGKTAAALFRMYELRADLIFIDAGHEYEMVRDDIRAYWPLLSERGVMFGDDYQMWMTAVAAHDVAKELNVPVMVAMRKWIYMTPALQQAMLPPGSQIRTQFDGWEIQHHFGDPEHTAKVVADYRGRVPM
jgi:predicted O-methyltransferase YrrM